jgi:putative SOS response-associated peptidase YedK
MCGRFAQSQDVVFYAHALDQGWTPPTLDLKPTWNMAPSRNVLVLHDDETGHVAELLHWGFLPSWADAKARKPINARVETAATSPYFRHAWKFGRCLIPADGWYEWKEHEHGKQPYFIHSATNEPIFMAGLYTTNPQVNITSFAIITTDAKGKLVDIHDREPLVLTPEAGKQWIRRDISPDQVIEIAKQPMKASSFYLACSLQACEQYSQRWC